MGLHFAETYWTAAGNRVFNTSINGTQVLTGFDIFATVGAANKGYIKECIVINQVTVTDNALISGIELYRISSGTNGTTTSHGTPVSWLQSRGIIDNFESADVSDQDLDGMATWQEYIAGTEPFNAASVFKITNIGNSGDGISWYGTTNSGITTPFRVYRCTALFADDWNAIATNISRSADGTNTWTDPSPPQGIPSFYRIGARKE